MSGARGFRRLLRWPRRGGAEIGAAVDEEIEFHVAMRTRELEASGMDAGAARREAEREFGDIALTRAELIASDARLHRRRTRRDALGDGLRELRIAVRTLLRAPLFTAVSVGTLGLGIGASAALFSVVDGVLLKPLPYASPGELVAVAPAHSFLRAEFDMLRERSSSYGVVGVSQGGAVAVSSSGEAVRVPAAWVSAELFAVLGVTPAAGRGFAAAEERAGAAVVVLSHGLALERFGGAAAALSQELTVDGAPHTVIGVMPPRFGYPTAAVRLWLPLVIDAAQPGTYWGLAGAAAVGRLASGVTPEQARQELVMLAAEMRLANPFWTPNEPYRAENTVEPLAQRLTGDARTPLLLLLGATLFLLLIGCANVGNLFLVRVLGRQRDLAVRNALGGGRRHVLRTVALESVAVALAGGALGVLLAAALVRVLPPLLPPETPRLDEVALDARVLLFALAATFCAALVFALLPALRAARGGAPDALRTGARTAGADRSTRRLAWAAVAGQVALAAALLAGAALLARSMQQLLAVDPGFRTAGVVAARISPPERVLPDAPSRRAFYGGVLESLAAVPGIGAVALTAQLPFDGELSLTAAAIEHVTTDPNELPVFDFLPITPSYFDVLGIPLREGRGFGDADHAEALPVAIVDRRTADRFFPGGSALGARIGRPWLSEWRTIVGVVESVRNHDLAGDDTPAFYVPFAQHPMASATLVVRSALPPGALAPVVRAAVRDADAGVPVGEVRRLATLVETSVAGTRSVSLLLGSFAGVALLLGALGIYGVLAYSVERRGGELGVRAALGATAPQLRGMVLREGALLVAAGLALGAPIAFVAGRLLEGLLFGVAPTDPVSLVAAFGALAGAALLAALLPAARAGRVEPGAALRGE